MSDAADPGELPPRDILDYLLLAEGIIGLVGAAVAALFIWSPWS